MLKGERVLKQVNDYKEYKMLYYQNISKWRNEDTMRKLIYKKIRFYIRLMLVNQWNVKDLFGNLQGYINAMLDCKIITYNQYRKYLQYIGYKFNPCK